MGKYLTPIISIAIVLLILVIIIIVLRKLLFTSEKTLNETIVNRQEDDSDDESEKIDVKIWKKIFKIIVKDKKSITIMIIAVINLGINDIIYPLLNTYALEHFFNETPDFSTRWYFIVAYIIITLHLSFSVWAFIKSASIVEENTTIEIRKQAFDKLQQLSFSYYDTTSSGWIMARMTSDTRKLANIISWGIVDLLWGIIFMIGILGVTLFINWKLSLILIITLPIFFVLTIYFRSKILKEQRDVRKINSEITASFNESFLGSNTIKTLVLEKENEKEFEKLINKMKVRSIRASIFSSLFWPTILVIGYLSVSIIATTGSTFVLSENAEEIIKTGTLYLFLDYAMRFFDPVMSIARIISDFQQAQASAERVISLIETNPDVQDSKEVIEKYGDLYNPKRKNFEPIYGKINFNNVSFKYKGTQKNVLENFNLQINKGEMIALVGETGSGKSTIVNLISRFYEPTEGEILIDDENYRNRSIGWLHESLGYVLQTPHLFSGNIIENVRYGKLDATDEEVKKACEMVNADEFINKLPDGYYTDIGEGGNKLSIGQKQLLSFARAIISNPKILILDEATSSIDTENEKIIQNAIKTILKDRTSIVVAHRLSTVVDADKIIVLRDGKIIEEGTHHQLLNKKGYYFNLYKNQFIEEYEQNQYKTL